MKKSYKIVIAIVLAIVLGLVYKNQIQTQTQTQLKGVLATAETMVGSASNAVSLPDVTVFANATTTDASSTHFGDGGYNINQVLSTNDVEKVRLDILSVGGTVTSTISFIQQISHDGTNWFTLHASSTPSNLLGYATNSPIVLTPVGISFTPGLASTSYSFVFDTQGARNTRFLFSESNLTTDPKDGVQAWIQAVKFNTRN